MADLRNGLEAELARQLAPVSAPDSLWSRIHEQRRPLRVRRQPWRVWSIAAAAALLLLAGFAWRARASRGPVGELANTAEKVDFRSGLRPGSPPSTPAEIRRTVQARLGVDVPMPERTKAAERACLLCHVNTPALMVR